MDVNQQKEQFSITYIRAIAAVAGYSLYRPEVDNDSIDLGIVSRGGTGKILSPRLELQLKCTAKDIRGENYIKYPLNLKNYNDLRINALVPRILVVVLVPEKVTDWLKQTEEELCLKHCAYWVSLYGMPETENTTNVTIEIPRSNLFTADAVLAIIQRISFGGLP
ncbi:DUF4365 domain-containing protein [Aetokthonos hydrillicola Thurmond2011]|jgi:hypothetical protein|uniref:DUF4365 domain-containing protein n=1 Tax=Aetokthonos hydrillicola Thurmond2011 TaxID=2712845 RepID=A0AAP5I8E2_9CYAN|nr:DUF4365 domain-containing protein [Aetokthonos hydrillicola]MBO3460986.1 DUF4365 domain-containing protein [Aetokthonos hydrillicola CCALA 1050]MBW4583660.1 DUF4365 domain-containing protein [Aetokthonos hydrillicola CCALA 1050]MDR9895644.1 DUF4365 domain-containing protein [Aetokthonos hydrillicola Thurmond2011]